MSVVIEHEYRTIDKSDWPLGPWQAEPDKLQWTDEATGLPCLIKRGPVGALCGYVGVPEGHPYFQVDYTDSTEREIAHHCDVPWCNPSPEHVLTVHGGITYSAVCQEGDESESICHIPKPGEPEHVWWLGFDCAHAYDVSPLFLGRLPVFEHQTYRDLAYVQAECTRLAAQLKAMEVAA